MLCPCHRVPGYLEALKVPWLFVPRMVLNDGMVDFEKSLGARATVSLIPGDVAS